MKKNALLPLMIMSTAISLSACKLIPGSKDKYAELDIADLFQQDADYKYVNEGKKVQIKQSVVVQGVFDNTILVVGEDDKKEVYGFEVFCKKSPAIAASNEVTVNGIVAVGDGKVFIKDGSISGAKSTDRSYTYDYVTRPYWDAKYTIKDQGIYVDAILKFIGFKDSNHIYMAFPGENLDDSFYDYWDDDNPFLITVYAPNDDMYEYISNHELAGAAYAQVHMPLYYSEYETNGMGLLFVNDGCYFEPAREGVGVFEDADNASAILNGGHPSYKFDFSNWVEPYAYVNVLSDYLKDSQKSLVWDAIESNKDSLDLFYSEWTAYISEEFIDPAMEYLRTLCASDNYTIKNISKATFQAKKIVNGDVVAEFIATNYGHYIEFYFIS